MKPNCNRCDQRCPYTFRIGKDVRRGMMKEDILCKLFKPPKDTWMLAELALAHPTSLNAALSALPFDVSLTFYLR